MAEVISDRPGFWRGFRVGAAFGSTITLHLGTGICRGEARAAVWRPAPGSDAAPIPGCWIFAGGVVLVSFIDGERADIPRALLVKAQAS